MYPFLFQDVCSKAFRPEPCLGLLLFTRIAAVAQ
ncbi:hypothetical protein M7I_1263 [Glarea lozoyensis 74030]|uniref:Uncharacterized protein n=1 Tax=Glarea lozoyensis (strain ATCC 74030 / MF5533) TaxID=1104152 RepID=H0EFI7_GLAL7|nr:hypothetical protein M7I_1263 [Glarea lozoyensis 74030]